MKKHFNYLLLLFASVLLLISCSDNEVPISSPCTSNSEIYDSIAGLSQFKQSCKLVVSQLSEKSFNYNTLSTRAMQADNDTIKQLSKQLSNETKKLLEQNDIDFTEVTSVRDSDFRMAYIGLLILDYDRVSNSRNMTRASLGDCILRAAGIGDLVKKGLGKRVVLKALIKAGLKRSIPYIGWGLAIGEVAACLAGH